MYGQKEGISLKLTHILRVDMLRGREDQQDIDKGYPCNSNYSNRDTPSSEGKIPRD